ncbi:MAG: hypothetical protein ACYC1D_13935 [Acidimicrobiales bacterium]
MAWLRRRYGAGPLHLLSLLACFALTGYVVDHMLAAPQGLRIVIWFAAAVIAHDLVLWPLYTLADRGSARLARRQPERLPAVPWINHVRVPVVLSAVLLLVSFPLVLRLSEPIYHNASGLTEHPYLDRWLLVTGVAFAVSALLYALRLGRARRARAAT